MRFCEEGGLTQGCLHHLDRRIIRVLSDGVVFMLRPVMNRPGGDIWQVWVGTWLPPFLAVWLGPVV